MGTENGKYSPENQVEYVFKYDTIVRGNLEVILRRLKKG